MTRFRGAGLGPDEILAPLGAGGHGLSGGEAFSGLLLATNEQAWVIGYVRYSSELLVIDGLK